MGHRYYRSGEFARMTSVSVRTLRFYDRVGLLSPSRRTDSGYRLYCDADLVRLQQILALKFLGFSLTEIKAFVSASPQDLRQTLAQQRVMLTERRAQLEMVIEAIERAEQMLAINDSPWPLLVSMIQAIQMEQHNDWRKKYFNEEQLEKLAELSRSSYSPSAQEKLAARQWTEEDQRRVDEQYAALYAGVRRAVAEGKEPSSPEGQALAVQAIGLIEAFTSGDPDIEAGLQNWWSSYNELPAEQRPFQVPLTEAENAFLNQAKAIYQEQRSSNR